MPLELPPSVSLDAVNLLLKRAGWCPKDIDLLPKDAVYRFYLTNLRPLVNQIDLPQNEQTDTPFWIDTMALPTDLRRRKPMLLSLRRVFGTATPVLVLDPSLSTHCFRSAEEAPIRIRYSLWKQRLWTIEEAFFARRLIFRFANRMVYLDELLTTFSASRPLRVPVLKPPVEILLVDHESMMPHLICFANDIHATPENTIDKRELYRILRAGYLSSPKFRYFVEPGEFNLTKQACFAIQNIYQSTS
ncbi:hypothetical protein VCV18_011653 [Metarhizium anisopliae]